MPFLGILRIGISIFLAIVSQMRYNTDIMKKRTAMIRARTEPGLKKRAEAILNKLGISASDAINMYYSQIVLRKGIPFLVDLEENDKKELYTEVRDTGHFDELIGLNS